jgi:hypothetical protein
MNRTEAITRLHNLADKARIKYEADPSRRNALYCRVLDDRLMALIYGTTEGA